MLKKTLLAALLASALGAALAPSFAADAAPLSSELAARIADRISDRHAPAPTTVSEPMAKAVNTKLGSMWVEPPTTKDGWQQAQDDFAVLQGKASAEEAQAAGVSVESATIAGVPVFVLTPPEVDPNRKDDVVLHIHGGGYVFGKGIGGAGEAVPLAVKSRVKVISVDYRMPPKAPYPAAIDDAFAVYKALVQEHGAKHIAVMGTSTGGGMTLILGLQAAQGGVEEPAALIAGTPWSDLTKTGDSYVTNEYVDNILGTYDYTLKAAAELYADGANLKDPLLSPVYASDKDLKAFPPTLLLTGTRDLFLSNTARMHVRLLENGVPAELIVYEAQSHAQYYLVTGSPEAERHYTFLDNFLQKTLFAD